MKTEFEKMRNGELYDFDDEAIVASFRHAKSCCARLQGMSPYDPACRTLLEELIPDLPASATVNPPIFCDHGNGIHLGENAFVNLNCTFLDGADITIGRHTLIGPNCQFYTPQHPIDYRPRRQSVETCHPITIGDDCWLGGGVIVCPGVRIGHRCIIAAGSVVTHDIPDDSLAAGCPATVKRRLDNP